MRIPSTVPGYVLGAPLGRRVWSARPAGGGDPLAIKLPGQTAGTARREAAALAAVRHPNLVRVLDVVDTPAGPALVFARAACTLAEHVARCGTLPPGEVVTIGSAVAGALAALHRHGLVHGDVHPANVLIAPDGTPLLADLELAGPPAAPAAMTPGFVAPEVAAGGCVTASADQWALAVTCNAALDEAVPEPLLTALEVAMAPSPTERFADVEVFAAELRRACTPARLALADNSSHRAPTGRGARALMRSRSTIAVPTTRRFGPRPPPRTRESRRRRPLSGVALIAVAASAGVGGVLVLRAHVGAAPEPAACAAPAQFGDRFDPGRVPIIVRTEGGCDAVATRR
ncbi:MAG: protein kinase domain-containing protein [Acidimicrobiales bacterium]